MRSIWKTWWGGIEANDPTKTAAAFPSPIIKREFVYPGLPYVAVISDFVHRAGNVHAGHAGDAYAWLSGRRGPPPQHGEQPSLVSVGGGYLERLPLALNAIGLGEHSEIWDFGFGFPDEALPFLRATPHLVRRTFQLDEDQAPFGSSDMLGFVAAFGPPRILCVWGLGVQEAILQACAASTRIYNSIDAPALRIPPEVSRHFDLVLTGAQWQSDEVRRRHPEMPVMVLPIGPEFGDPETFVPLGIEKDYDIVYVAAAQPYKRHDILFDALEKLPREVRTLCVFGYGEMRGELEQRARDTGLAVDFVGPPGVGLAEVNMLMNRAKIGVVCGVDDGAPAILTEYMLAGLPVLANTELRCGLQYITPQTGATASAEGFHRGLVDLLEKARTLRPRDVALTRWTWPHSVARLASTIDAIEAGKRSEQARE